MIRVAFASTDRLHVNTHFGAAERFVVYDVAAGQADLVKVGDFIQVAMKGTNKDKALPIGTKLIPGEEMAPKPEELQKPPEDKVVEKLEFLRGCAAVYAASIGTSSIKRLMSVGIQPIIVGQGHEIVELLNEVSLALAEPGSLAWVDQARARVDKADDRFEQMATQGWPGAAAATPTRHQLITSLDQLPD